MFIAVGSTDTWRRLDRERITLEKKQEAEQRILDQKAARENERKENYDALHAELNLPLFEESNSTDQEATVPDSYLNLVLKYFTPSTNQPRSDIPLLNYRAILDDLEAKLMIVQTKLKATTTLKNCIGELYKNDDSPMDLEIAMHLSNIIYYDKIDVIKLVPERLTPEEIKKTLINAVANANLKTYQNFDPEGVKDLLALRLDYKTLFALITRVQKKISNSASLIEDAIDAYKRKMDEPASLPTVTILRGPR